MALGSTIGSVVGGVAGTILMPVGGTAAGAAIGGAIGGLGDSIAAKAKKKKSEGMLPEMVDPMEANRYAEMRLREKQLMTGTAFQTALGENRKAQAATIAGVDQASGGAGGAAIAAMLRADAVAGRTNNETLGKGLEQNNFLSQEMSALATRIAQRKFALQKQKYQQGMYDAAAGQGEANSDLKAQAARTDYTAIADMLGGMGNNEVNAPVQTTYNRGLFGQPPTEAAWMFNNNQANMPSPYSLQMPANQLPPIATPSTIQSAAPLIGAVNPSSFRPF